SSISHLAVGHDAESTAPTVPESHGTPNGDQSEFDAFVADNVRPQRQEGFSTIAVKVTRGDLSPEQFRGLAAIMREFTGGYARTTVQQNLVLRWVREESVYDVWLRLQELDLGGAGAVTLGDVGSCPRTHSCKPGITRPLGPTPADHKRSQGGERTRPLTRP